MPELTQKQLKKLLRYDKNTGTFTWRETRRGTARAGSIAGTVSSRDYRIIKVFDKIYFAHRLAWLYTHGCWPIDQIDHINGVRDDNRITNLRAATGLENQQNRKLSANNATGFMGVSADKDKFRAMIYRKSKCYRLGYFDTPRQAANAYLFAKPVFHRFNPWVR